jgi:hypothetical protein
MLKKVQQIVLAFFLFSASLYAQSVSVWTLDEQFSSTNLTVLRFKVQNIEQQTIRGLELHYRVKQEWSEIAPAEAYYIPGGNMEWIQQEGGEALLKISFPNATLEPMEEFPNSSGFSVGLHTKNWSAWSKSDDYSQPVSNAFALTDRLSVYSNGVSLTEETGGGTVSNAVCPEVWFLEIRTDSVKIGWLPSGNAEEQKTLELRSFSGASRMVDLLQAADSSGYMEWSGAFPVQHQNHGELWLDCSGKMAAYFAYGLTPENAGSAVDAGLWESESAFVRANAGMGYNMGILPEDRFIVEAEEFGRRISDWKLYHAWEAPDLPELPKIAFPGFGTAIQPESPNDSMLFAWTAVENTYMYQLHIVRDSVYGDTLLSMFVPDTEVRLPTPPPGVYVWWAEPVSITPRFGWSDAKRLSKKAVKAAVEVYVAYTVPILAPVVYYITHDDASVPEAIVNSYITSKVPVIGVFKIVNTIAGGVNVRKKTLNVPAIGAMKDTRMLDLGWGNQGAKSISNRWWDTLSKASEVVEAYGKNRCWAISIQSLNHYFGGTLTQDEIVYHGKSYRSIEKQFPHTGDIADGGIPQDYIPTMEFALGTSAWDYLKYGSLIDKIEKGLSDPKELFATAPGWYASLPTPYTVISNIEAGIPIVMQQMNQGYDGMHSMVVDGYKIEMDGSVYLRFLNTDNYGSSEWRYYASFIGLGADVLLNMALQSIANLSFKLHFGGNFYVAYYVPPTGAKGRLTDPDVDKDSDEDGIVDFDEKHRFGTNYKDKDSDKDGINDKAEIEYYVRENISADVDKDGLRAELDVDSDGDEDCDGDENANKNDKWKGEGETNMMDSSSVHPTRRNCLVKPVALLASHQLNMNDRAYCTNGTDYCPIASIGLAGGNAVQLGVSAKVGSIAAGSSVWLRSNASVSGDVRTWGTLILQDATPQVMGVVKQKDTAAFISSQVYRPLLSNSNFNMGIISGTMQIPSGQMVVLRPESYKQNIVVSSGSLLLLLPGTYKMGSLTVQSGGRVELMGSGNIALDIAGSFRWNGSFQGNGIQEAASRLMIRVQDSQDIFLNTSFGGFIVAPNAHVIAGQAEKEYAGQIYARRITLHQNVRFQWVRPGETFMNIATSRREVIYARSND